MALSISSTSDFGITRGFLRISCTEPSGNWLFTGTTSISSKPGGRISDEPGRLARRKCGFDRFDGEYRWFQIAAAPVYDEQGNVVRWCGINTDIDPNKCSEQKLRHDEADLRTIVDTIRQPIVVMAPDGATLYANRVALDRTGLTMDELDDQGFFAPAFHPDDIDRLRAARQLRGDSAISDRFRAFRA